MAKETLLEQIRNEKIVYPSNAYERGWNDALDYIVAEYRHQLNRDATTSPLDSGDDE